MNLAIVVLAAGAASRYGGNKLMAEHPISEQPLLHHVLREYGQINAEEYWVVSGAHEITMPKDTQWQMLANERWQNGMSGSIQLAISELSSAITHVLIGLGDQALIQHNEIAALVQSAQQHPDCVCVSTKQKTRGKSYGPPVIFPRRDFADLLKLTGDKGAGGLIKTVATCEPERLIPVNLPQAFVDIDTPEDWQQVKNIR